MSLGQNPQNFFPSKLHDLWSVKDLTMKKGGTTMNGEVIVFESNEFGQIRTITMDGEVYFVGKDVAEKLGYKETAKAVREHVEPEDKGVSVLDTPGGKQEMTIINESGLYSLILSSKLESARVIDRIWDEGTSDKISENNDD